MYLKSLELHGFKSFPNRTVLTFERGATVIVGPNGSGKSNISDAMRWVLGELSSRNIRGTKMEDVIFGGTDEKRPMGFAEVSVTFDNSDPDNRLDSEYDEVTVTRRYFRTGESEYLINRQPRRLRDIYELFMNTGVGREGYSIIGQGKIAEIISKKSDERRNIFEEAAGISKYRHRKEEAEKKLKNTQDNLDRVRDILAELENQVGPLEKEAEKARRGLAVYEEKKRADVSLWLYDTKKIREDIERVDSAFKLSKHELEIIDQTIADLETQNDTLYNKSQSNKLLSEQLLNEIHNTSDKMHLLDNALRVAESDFAHSVEMMEQCQVRIREIQTSKSNIQANKNDYFNKAESLRSDLQNLLDTRLEYLSEQQKLGAEIDKAKRELEEALDELTVEENSLSELNVRINVLENSKETDGTKSLDIAKEIEKYEAEGLLFKEESDICEKNASEFKLKIAVEEDKISKAEDSISSYTDEKESLTSELNSLKLELDQLIQRADVLQRMVEHFEGYSESVKFVMRHYSEEDIKGAGEIYGPLSSLVSVEKQYITAIETALGASLQNIVVDTEETAKAAIHALKQHNAGRATFYPISAIKSPSETNEIKAAKNMRGFIGRADTLVKYEARFTDVIAMLLLRTLVFDNIENASFAAKQLNYKLRIVTIDGQIINAGGSFTGGSAKRESGMLSRVTEINALRERGEALKSKIVAVQSSITDVEAEIRKAKENFNEATQSKEALLTLSRGQFSALDSANAKYEANRNIVNRLRADYDNLTGLRVAAEEELGELKGEYRANLERIEAIKDFRQRRAEEMGVIDEKSDELLQKANEIFIKSAETRKDIEGIEQIITTIDERLLELNRDENSQVEKIAEIQSKRDNIDTVKIENKAEYNALELKLDELNEKRRDVESGTDEFERELANIRVKLREKTSSRQISYEAVVKNENKLNQLEEKQDKLGSQLWDEYELTYQDAINLFYPPVTEENREEVGALQASCKAKLRAIGNFDPASIERFAEVKTRYDSLNTQFIDLTKSYDELIGIISRLEDEMKSSFLEAFEAINRNFSTTFRELFGGGNAELLLTEPDDVLTSGIEIKAAPPGKIIKSLSLLSGGEQSFVAIALLFAILKVNPTPFCILDEIEAALDEVNVYRFGEYIKSFNDGTQFILITHRRGTMEIGDRLYGVTMPQRGISQAIELNVNEIEGKQKELLDGVL